MTKQNLFCAWLISKGWIEVVNQSSRNYRTFMKPDILNHYYVGHQGGVRYGRIRKESISITHRICWEKLGYVKD